MKYYTETRTDKLHATVRVTVTTSVESESSPEPRSLYCIFTSINFKNTRSQSLLTEVRVVVTFGESA